MILQLDTNICIYLLKGILRDPLPEAEYCISVITRMELLSFSLPSQTEEKLLMEFLKELKIIPLDEAVQEQAIALRKTYSIKLPDAIIAATALTRRAVLASNDRDLSKVPELNVMAMPLIP